MRKFLLTAAAALTCSAAAFSADYTVYQNGTVGAGLNVNTWWNVVLDREATNPSGNGKVFSMTYNPAEAGGGATGPNFCAGIQAPDGSSITGPLWNATLTFSYYSTTACKMTVRLDGNGVEENYVVEVAAADANKWNQVSIPVAANYPKVSEIWKADSNDGMGDVFGMVVENFNAETVCYFDNIIFTNIDGSWIKPETEKPFCPTPAVPTQSPASVKSLLSGAYEPVCGFNIGGWGQSTKVKNLTADNGAPVQYLTNFNYLGWELTEHIDVTDCNYMHVEYYSVNGTTLGIVPITGTEAPYNVTVKEGEWNVFDIPLTDFSNRNFADLYQIKWDQGNGSNEGYLANVFFYNSNYNAAPVKLYIENKTEWENLYIYAWATDEPELFGGWPGKQLAETETVNGVEYYVVTVDPSNVAYNVIFNNGAEGDDADQFDWGQITPNQDLTIVAEKKAIDPATAVKIYVKNETGWEHLYIYGWAENQPELFGKWPGAELTETETVDGVEYYVVSVTGTDVAYNIIFNNGQDGGEQFDYAEPVTPNENVTLVAALAGIETIDAAANAPVVFYNLQGVRVANPSNGIFLMKSGNTVSKVLVK